MGNFRRIRVNTKEIKIITYFVRKCLGRMPWKWYDESIIHHYTIASCSAFRNHFVIWGAVMILCLAALLAAVCPISAIAADPKTIQAGCPLYVAKPFCWEKPEEVIG